MKKETDAFMEQFKIAYKDLKRKMKNALTQAKRKRV
jgi:hypothetical protein